MLSFFRKNTSPGNDQTEYGRPMKIKIKRTFGPTQRDKLSKTFHAALKSMYAN